MRCTYMYNEGRTEGRVEEKRRRKRGREVVKDVKRGKKMKNLDLDKNIE